MPKKNIGNHKRTLDSPLGYVVCCIDVLTRLNWSSNRIEQRLPWLQTLTVITQRSPIRNGSELPSHQQKKKRFSKRMLKAFPKFSKYLSRLSSHVSMHSWSQINMESTWLLIAPLFLTGRATYEAPAGRNGHRAT